MIKTIFILSFALSIPLAILILPMVGLNGIIQKLDWYSPFYIFSLQFAIGLLLFIKLFPDFCDWIKSILHHSEFMKWQSIIGIFVIITIAVFTCIFYIEGQSRVQMDESVYLVTAQNLYYNQTGTICEEGTFEDGEFQCAFTGTIKPRGLSYLYMLGMPVFGTDLRWVYNFQTFILAFTLLIFFFSLLAWVKNCRIALLSTALLANVPIYLFLSRSASIEGLYVFMFALSLLFLKWAIDRGTIRHYLLLALTLAFLAQTRSEAVFCLFAFIGVVFYKNIYTLNPKNELWIAKIASHLSSFPYFLLTLSFFSIPIFCTLSLNRDSNLQGGAYSSHGHLFENIIADFKIMALENFQFSENFYFPYFPYFTWLALAGLIIFILHLLPKRSIVYHLQRLFPLPLAHCPLPKLALVDYKKIAIFLLLLSPQYIILFDAVSADFHLDVQQRFVLVVLPIMSFLGAFFVCWVLSKLKYCKVATIFYLLILLAILANTCFYTDSFKQQNLYQANSAIAEQKEINKFLLNVDKKSSIFFSYTPMSFLEKGVSAYNYFILSFMDNNTFIDLKSKYEDIFFVENSSCTYSRSVQKMASQNSTRLCDRTLIYFNIDTALKVNLLKNRFETLTIYKILGLSDRDPNGFLRIMNKIEPNDSTILLFFKTPKDTNASWKINHYLNDSLFKNSTYSIGDHTDSIEFSKFNRDTNIWRLDIVDTLTDSVIHSDFWQLTKTAQGKGEK